MAGDIRITAKSIFLPFKSDAAAKRFAFAYTITIENLGDEAVTLKTRRWLITDANNSLQEVQGEGVVGETPTINSGGSFTYTSAAVIATETGTMEGSYGMENETGDIFEVKIPMFILIPPHALH